MRGAASLLFVIPSTILVTLAMACGGKDPQPTTPTATQPPPGWGTAPPPTSPQPTGWNNPPPTATGPAPTAPPPATAPAGTMAVPGPAALVCQQDSQCFTHHCNVQYGKCAFPCQSNVDCMPNNNCTMGACVPKLPGQP